MSSNLRAFSWLHRHSRGIRVRGENITVLRSPDEFYQTLLEQTRTAQRRIKISSLYLGTGELESGLVRTITSSVRESPRLNCDILLDYLRGTRGTTNSVTALVNLLKSSSRARLYLYHTPLLRGLAKHIIPDRFNEGAGLQHTKIHVFDDNVLLTGANLSHDYFTRRRDRYILFKDSRELSEYIVTLYDIICDHSHNVNVDNSSWSISSPVIDPLEDPTTHKQLMEDCVTRLINSHHQSTEATEDHTRELASMHFNNWTDSCSTNQSHSQTTNSVSIDHQHSNHHTHSHSNEQTHSHSNHRTNPQSTDTIVFPLIQMGPYNIKQDETVTSEILSSPLTEEDKICLASGYFNLPPQYSAAILKGRGAYSVLAASPQRDCSLLEGQTLLNKFIWDADKCPLLDMRFIDYTICPFLMESTVIEANGFYGAKGVAKYVPFMYVHFARLFLELINNKCFNNRIKYYEYQEDGWTFHSKGFRSLTRDLEFQVAVVSDNKALQASLHYEMVSLYNKGQRLTLSDVLSDRTRKLSPLVLMTTKLLQKFV